MAVSPACVRSILRRSSTIAEAETLFETYVSTTEDLWASVPEEDTSESARDPFVENPPSRGTTVLALAVLLDRRASILADRLVGASGESLGFAEGERARVRRERLLSAVDKVLARNPLTDAELRAAREAVAWYRTTDVGDQLPLETCASLVESWNVAADPAADAASLEDLARRARRGVDATAEARGGRARVSQAVERSSLHGVVEPIDVQAEAVYEQARREFAAFGHRLADGDLEGAMLALDDVVEQLGRVRDRLRGFSSEAGGP